MSGREPDPDPLPKGLRDLLARRYLVLGIGSDLRGDDAFGSLLARRLRARGLPALDGGTAPENLTGPVRRARPEVLLLVDAADLGEPEGTIRLADPADLPTEGPSTHAPGIGPLVRFLTAEMDLTVRLLARQPGPTRSGDPPTAGMLAAVDRLAAAWPGPDPTAR